MPELPEVETMVHRLQEWVGSRIDDIVIDPRMSLKAAKKYLPGDEYNDTIGQAITGVYRRGKFIVFTTSSGALLAHNAMSGYWDSADRPWTFDYVEGARVSSDNDVRVIFTLERGGELYKLRFHDARMFGSIRYVDPSQLAEKLSELGPDALHTKHLYEPRVADGSYFYDVCQKSKKPIKEILMDQGKLAGVGNIYAAEALFHTEISPFKPANELTRLDANGVFAAAQVVMANALVRKLDYAGLRVYRKKRCDKCDTEISSGDLKGRTTWWCSQCQK